MLTDPSARQGEARYWYFAVSDIADRSYLDEFNRWYNRRGGHINDHLAVEGINHAWRTQEIDHPANYGPAVQEFASIYQCDRIDPFESTWIPTSPQVEASEVRRKAAARNWGKVLYRVLSALESDERAGRFWVREEFDVDPTEIDVAVFERHAQEDHLTKVVARPGVHRGWQLRAERGNPHQKLPHAWDHVNVYEVDSPDDILEDGTLGDSSPFVPDGIHVAQLLFEMYEEQADPSLVVDWRVEPARTR
jgi:hypothetical protein